MEESKILEKLRKYLQDEETQARIQSSIKEWPAEATVSIGRAAQLFDLKESKIRDLEARGLLNPVRTKEATGQRQYSFEELNKLALIKDLMDEGDFSASDIPANVYDFWQEASRSSESHKQPVLPIEVPGEAMPGYEDELMPIDQRVENNYSKKLFWRYYTSHVLRLALMLVREEIRFTRGGFILPLERKTSLPLMLQPQDLRDEDLRLVGESLVAWIDQSRSSFTLLTRTPSFEFPSDFRIMPLRAMQEGILQEDTPGDNTLMIIPRQEAENRLLTLSNPVVETVRRLLEPFYYEVPDWHLYLGQGMYDIVEPFIDFNNRLNLPDILLRNIADIIVHLGGKSNEGKNRWRFCCILLPNNNQLPLQQQSLVVRAKTKEAPIDYKVGATVVHPTEIVISMSLRALQSGRIIYRHMVTHQDTSIEHRDWEEPIGSAIAVPVGGETTGLPIAVIYVVSAQPKAFSKDDQRLLRVLGRMVEELLSTYQVRMQTTEKFTDLIRNPSLVDPTFASFTSENDFINDLEALLKEIEAKEDVAKFERNFPEIYTTKESVSLLAVDIDNLTNITNKYGDRVTKNLSREVGIKLKSTFNGLFANSPNCKLYHIYADRFYMLLNGISLDEARTKADLLKQALNGSYQVNALRLSIEKPAQLESKIDLSVTVRLGVANYPYWKVQEILKRYSAETAFASTMAQMARQLDSLLKVGLDAGGNVTASWDHKFWGMIILSPPAI